MKTLNDLKKELIERHEQENLFYLNKLVKEITIDNNAEYHDFTYAGSPKNSIYYALFWKEYGNIEAGVRGLNFVVKATADKIKDLVLVNAWSVIQIKETTGEIFLTCNEIIKANVN